MSWKGRYVPCNFTQICGFDHSRLPEGKSAMIMFEKYSRVKRNFKGHSFWARGYYVNTVGLDEAKVRKYIKDQDTNEMVDDRWNSNPESDPF